MIYASGLHTVARCARVCRAAREAAQKADLWQMHVLRTCKLWCLPALKQKPWREQFLSLLSLGCHAFTPVPLML